MLKPINWKMISHPMNWLVVVLMVVIAGAIGHSILSYLGVEPSTQPQSEYADIPAGITYVKAGAVGIQPQGSDDV